MGKNREAAQFLKRRQRHYEKYHQRQWKRLIRSKGHLGVTDWLFFAANVAAVLYGLVDFGIQHAPCISLLANITGVSSGCVHGGNETTGLRLH